jgi:hypothetical protein
MQERDHDGICKVRRIWSHWMRPPSACRSFGWSNSAGPGRGHHSCLFETHGAVTRILPNSSSRWPRVGGRRRPSEIWEDLT